MIVARCVRRANAHAQKVPVAEVRRVVARLIGASDGALTTAAKIGPPCRTRRRADR